MICTDEYLALLDQLLLTYGIVSTQDQRHTLLRHLDLVNEKNKVMNLTRITDPRDAVVRHVVDSLLLLPSIESHIHTRMGRLLDIGTGAGFPGIPLVVMTDVQGLFIDSVGKKVQAVNEFIQDLDLSQQARAQAIRAEDLARTQRNAFDLVTARAVAELGVLVEYASPLLTRQGSLVVSKARLGEDEFEQGVRTAELVGMQYVSRETYELPDEMGHREILTFTSVAKSTVKLPRATGMAKHHPLVGLG